MFIPEFTGDLDNITAQYFTGSGVHVRGHTNASVEAALNRMFKKQLGSDEIRCLTGAPDGSNIYCSYDADNPSVHFTIRNPAYYIGDSERILRFRKSDQTLELHNRMLRVNRDVVEPGFGPRVFAHQVVMARLLGIPRISTRTAGRFSEIEQWAGYYVWPLCGFNTTLSDDDKRLLPPEFGHVDSLVELVSTEEGRRWWKEWGYPESLIFLLRDESESMDQFIAYMAAKQIRL